jgi:hypothetical protein
MNPQNKQLDILLVVYVAAPLYRTDLIYVAFHISMTTYAGFLDVVNSSYILILLIFSA